MRWAASIAFHVFPKLTAARLVSLVIHFNFNTSTMVAHRLPTLLTDATLHCCCICKPSKWQAGSHRLGAYCDDIDIVYI